MESEDTICYCFHITKRKIQNFIRLNRLRRASQISECGGAGTGCGWCIPYLQKYFDESQSGDSCPETLNPEEYARQRAEYILSGKGQAAAGAIPLPESGGLDDTR